MHKATGLKIGVFLAVLSMILVLGCSSGVAQKDYDAVKAQLTAAQQQATTAQQQLTTKEQDLAKAQQELAARGTGGGTGPAAVALQQELTKAKADLQAALAAGQQAKQKNPVIWTETKPLPAPAPTATPVPPGFTPAPAATPPAELVNEVIPFTFYIETLTGHQTSTIVQSPSCVPNSQFRRGAHLVWRFEVVDTATGKRLTSLDKDVTIKLVLPNKEEKIARYSKRAGTGPWMWSFAWDVPLDYTLGTLDYQIVATKGARTGTFDQDTLGLVNKDRGIDSRLQIVE